MVHGTKNTDLENNTMESSTENKEANIMYLLFFFLINAEDSAESSGDESIFQALHPTPTGYVCLSILYYIHNVIKGERWLFFRVIS